MNKSTITKHKVDLFFNPVDLSNQKLISVLDEDDAAAEIYLDMSAPLPADPKKIVTPTEHTDSNRPYRIESRKIPIPPHRYSLLKSSWQSIYPPLVEHLQLQVRMNVKNRAVELRTSRHTMDLGALQKGEDFVKAFALGFDTADAIALLRLDDLLAIGTSTLQES
jgi:hypothetical protein